MRVEETRVAETRFVHQVGREVRVFEPSVLLVIGEDLGAREIEALRGLSSRRPSYSGRSTAISTIR